jgi:murein DD-endopeptidase MepM/ murein hydrolase activator NlpD
MTDGRKISPNLFSWISWGITALIVVALLGFTFWRIFPAQASPVTSTSLPAENSEPASLPGLEVTADNTGAIVRVVALDTSIEDSIRYEVIDYTVERGDTVSNIADSFGISSDSLMWANEPLMQDGPSSLSIGQVLMIPPVDGVLYQWEDGDSLDAIADDFDVSPDDILLWPGNKLDLADPIIKSGDFIMIPGGISDAIVYTSVYSSGASSGSVTSCGGEGPIGGGGALICPSPYCYINGGNPFSGGHLAVDLYAPEGTPIVAADSGVVIKASYGEWNGGYGNMVMIDHRNGFVTLYGHLSQVNVYQCQPIGAGEILGLSGNTGNSFGAHLHFEVRLWDSFVNPWDYLVP